MKLQAILAFGVVAVTSTIGSVAMADTYSTVTTTNEGFPLTETREVRTTTVESAPTAVVQPMIYMQPAPEVVVIKKHHHHLINLGPVKVF